MIKEFIDFFKSFVAKSDEDSFTKKTYTEHGIIALGRAQGMTEEELAFLSKSIHKLENRKTTEKRGSKDTLKVELSPESRENKVQTQGLDEIEIENENIK